MVASLGARVAQADEKFKGLQAYLFFVKGVSLTQRQEVVVLTNDRIASTCNLNSWFPVCLTRRLRNEFASPHPHWRHFLSEHRLQRRPRVRGNRGSRDALDATQTKKISLLRPLRPVLTGIPIAQRNIGCAPIRFIYR